MDPIVRPMPRVLAAIREVVGTSAIPHVLGPLALVHVAIAVVIDTHAMRTVPMEFTVVEIPHWPPKGVPSHAFFLARRPLTYVSITMLTWKIPLPSQTPRYQLPI